MPPIASFRGLTCGRHTTLFPVKFICTIGARKNVQREGPPFRRFHPMCEPRSKLTQTPASPSQHTSNTGKTHEFGTYFTTISLANSGERDLPAFSLVTQRYHRIHAGCAARRD